MTQNPPFHQEEKDIQQLPQWERQVFARLEEARQLQARTLQQCAQAQARVARLEARLQALRKGPDPLPSEGNAPGANETDTSEAKQQPGEPIGTSHLAEQVETLSTFLPENGDLESLASFPVQEDTGQETTERMAVLQRAEGPESPGSLLPEDGDLESLTGFPVQEETGQETTERLTVLKSEEPT
jgi:hypothetical protein